MKKINCCVFTAFLLFPLSAWAQRDAFDISGSIKTVNKSERPEVKTPRGEVRVEENQKVLEIQLRRVNPTVSGEIKVRWVVMIEDMRGNLRPVIKGERKISVEVGIPTTLESDAFTLTEADFKFEGRHRDHGNKLEQEVKGYAVLVLDAEGNELASKFQPGSVEKKVREMLAEEAENKAGGAERNRLPARR